MAALDLERLLEPVSDDAPSGESVEYDEQFLELDKLARGVAQEQDAAGNVVREGEGPDWPEVERITLELSEKSKDLRVALFLTRARLSTTGLPGLQDGLELIAGYLEKYWPSLHPALDPDDNDDPSARLNTLASLCHADGLLRNLRTAPLTQSRQFGRISYRDYAIAHGTMAAPAGQTEGLPDASRIEAAFADTELAVLRAARESSEAALAAIERIDEALSEAIGAGQGIDFDPLRKVIREIEGVLDPQLAKREGEEADEGAAAEGDGERGPRPAASGGGASGAIRGRNDVVAMLDKICRYYADHEPSSPVPMILERTKRLVTMSFMDILKDLTPGGVQEFGVIAGIREEEESE